MNEPYRPIRTSPAECTPRPQAARGGTGWSPKQQLHTRPCADTHARRVVHSETVLRGFYDFHRDGHRPDHEPISARSVPSFNARERTPQPDGRVGTRPGGPLSAEGAKQDSPGDPR